MTLRAKPFRNPPISQRTYVRHHVAVACIVIALVGHAIGCSGDVQDNRTTTSASSSDASSSGSSSTAGMGGFGGAGGMGTGTAGNGGMGTGGTSMDGGTGDVEYFGYNLFTHVPRFIIMKVDHTRNLCFRIWVEGFSGPGPLSIDVTNPWAASHAEVTNNAGDCTMSMGFPPQPAELANATSGTGTLMISGAFPCAVDLHATISFDPVAPWVPTSETFDVDALNVDGGCG